MSAPGELAISQVWSLGLLERYQKGRLNLFGSLVQRGGEIAFLAASSSTIAARKASQRVSPTSPGAWLVRASNPSLLGSPEGVFQIDDGAKRTILTNIERQLFARTVIEPVFDRVGGGNRTVPW